MPLRVADRLSWSLRHGAIGDYGNGVFIDLVDACRKTCDEHFPAADGYDVRAIRVSGPLEGINLEVTRGKFRALISVQRYRRLVGLADGERHPTEIRVVAAARQPRVTALARRSSGLAGIGAAGCTVGSLGVGVGGLEYAGLLTAWGIALLMLPILMGLRMFWAIRIARNLRRKALESAPTPALESASREDDAHRWKGVLVDLQHQRETLSGRLTVRPFRSIPTAVSRRLRSAG